MNTDELTAALDAHVPDQEAVLARMAAKRSARRRRRLLTTGAVASVAALIAVGAVWWPRGDDPRRLGPPAAGPAQVADGCAVIPLAEVIAAAKTSGASVIVADGTLTGRSARSELIYHEMALTSVRTLTGPSVAIGSHAWVSGQVGPSGPVPGADAGALWGPHGGLFAIVTPSAVGPLLRVAPVVGDQVILSSAGCWDAGTLRTRPFTGRLSEIPGSDSYTRAQASGFHAVRLSDIETLTARK